MNPLRSLTRAPLVIALALWLAAALLRWWLAPAWSLLPADYVAEQSYDATMRTRRTPAAAAEVFETHVTRRDQVVASAAAHAVIQGSARWTKPTGELVFETQNGYGVDRRTRQNLRALGDAPRDGQYLFPPRVREQDYPFWDPLYGGPWTARFARAESFRGLEVYVFEARTEPIDETAGYESLPDVPEHYLAITRGHGQLRVEPVSGVVVDQQDEGVSDFVDPRTSARVGAPINEWRQRFTEETVVAQLRLATAARRRTLALELWLPVALAAAGALVLGAAWLRRAA